MAAMRARTGRARHHLAVTNVVPFHPRKPMRPPRLRSLRVSVCPQAEEWYGRRHFQLSDHLARDLTQGDGPIADRKSTRLNSSHVAISYAVFCLKKKKTEHAC